MLANDYNAQLSADIGSFACDPLGFVLYAFPWGEGGLEGESGPEAWQREVLQNIGDDLMKGVGVSEAVSKAIRIAIASGHGIGKSALVAWVILWAMSTCVDTRGVVTANTEMQLKSKTWAELAKWHRLCLCGQWFDCTATALISKLSGHEKTWRCDMVPWSERNTEAFAGLHNKGKRVFLIFDEASAIPDLIWETAEGALTDEDTEILWLAFGNPTRNTGKFFECFHLLRHRWINRKIDSRTVSLTNKAQLQEWIDDYGEESDFVKVRVRGEFPASGINQIIPTELVEAAMERTLPLGSVEYAPIILSIDPSLEGKDRKVIVVRQGIYAYIAGLSRKPMSTGEVATWAASIINKVEPDYITIDQTGIGAGVRDWLRSLGFSVIGIDFGSSATEPNRFVNRSAEMWWKLRDWLEKDSPALESNSEFRDDLTKREYVELPSGKIQLESKKDMAKRGLPSPDIADALVQTFTITTGAKARVATNTYVQEFDYYEGL